MYVTYNFNFYRLKKISWRDTFSCFGWKCKSCCVQKQIDRDCAVLSVVLKSLIMDPCRIEAYIRATCSVLDFDIGELWCAKKQEGIHCFLQPDETAKFMTFYTWSIFFYKHREWIELEVSSALLKSNFRGLSLHACSTRQIPTIWQWRRIEAYSFSDYLQRCLWWWPNRMGKHKSNWWANR